MSASLIQFQIKQGFQAILDHAIRVEGSTFAMRVEGSSTRNSAGMT